MKHIVRAGESLYSIAKQYGLTVAQLKHLNRLITAHLRVGQELTVSGIFPTAENATQAKEQTDIKPETNLIASKAETDWHIVVPGETLFGIARQYGVTVAQLVAGNGLLSNNLKVGQKLTILREETKQIEPVKNTSDFTTNAHIVVRGDSWYSIAKKYELTVQELKALNHASSDLLSIGQRILLTDTPSDKIEFTEIITPKEEKTEEVNKNQQEDQPIPEIIQKEENTEKEPSDSIEVLPEDIRTLPEATQMRLFLEARKIFRLEATNGIDLFESGLRGAVGRNHVNRPEDLDKIQNRLIQLGMLAANHPESLTQIRQRHGGGAITANLIPKTIEAIERFQSQFRIRFWIEHSMRIAMMKTNSFTPGVIMPDDITYKVLREYTQYRLTFPQPQDGKATTVKFYNFPLSPSTKYYQGVSFVGNSNPEIPLSVFNRLGISEDLAKALQYVSRHEGNFDAINSYDEAVFSYGFIQFAGNGGGLAPLLANIKHKAPKVFQEFFQRYGIDVDFVIHQGQLRQAKLLTANPYDKGGKYWVEGLAAEMVLREDKQLYGVFIRAGHHLPIITLQIDTAIRNYVLPALGIYLNAKIGATQLPNVPITEYIRSPLGLALLIDLTVNQWVLRAKEIFRSAVERTMARFSLKSLEELKQLDERRIIEQIITDAKEQNDMRLVQRATGILQSNLSWEKTQKPLLV
jgi:peptidoglycan endopeptidase LytF